MVRAVGRTSIVDLMRRRSPSMSSLGSLAFMILRQKWIGKTTSLPECYGCTVLQIAGTSSVRLSLEDSHLSPLCPEQRSLRGWQIRLVAYIAKSLIRGASVRNSNWRLNVIAKAGRGACAAPTEPHLRSSTWRGYYGITGIICSSLQNIGILRVFRGSAPCWV